MAGTSKLEAPVASSLSSPLDAAEHRATRRRKMVAKQRGRRTRRRPASDADAASGSVLDLNVPALDPDQAVDGLRFLLQKELRNSDVSQLGRIVLPKKEAESHLPNLTSRDGIAINMDDLENLQVWTFKFWPNNRSRMYILENTGDYVKEHHLELGDFIMIYKDDSKDRYVIRAKKAGSSEPSVAPADDGIFDSILPDIVVGSVRYSDLFLPLAEGMNVAYGYGLSYAFEEDFPMTFPDGSTGS
ncbi:B3 domain-containing protein LFL1-like isoform X2 [Musa acuminata AAA Group]|uniref:B3 domain-containing protein LFL1-like isoform X2 n=1 Tax=Musa acuminata AAA Group TaxID=214697 RepID=UPI0008A0F4B7|nr:PREDICTED: B3 domain-containing protein LFL1-like isoform X2 [Musa acuminata subsp. malaccensis]